MNKLLLTLTIVLTGACISIADDTEKDLKKLAGTWEPVSTTEDGKDKSADELKGEKVVIDEKGNWEVFKDGNSLLKGSVKLDPSKKPKAADWSVEGADIVAKGIYELDGDKFKHCFSLMERPTEFGSKEGSGITNIVFKKAKK